jgi:hypothetical protein
MDVLAPTTMKNAVKCDTSCESQNPVSHQNFERSLHFLGSMSVGVSVHQTLLDRGESTDSELKRVKMKDYRVVYHSLVSRAIWRSHDVKTLTMMKR